MSLLIRPLDQNATSFIASARDAQIGLNNCDAMLEFHGDIDYRRKHDLALVLKECCNFESTDPRDKVFALLGLTSDSAKSHIKVNYNGNYKEGHVVREVYTNAMLFILAHGDNPIKELEGAGIGTERSISDFPSWVPDWSLTNPFRMESEANSYTSGTRYETKINLDQSADLMIAIEGLKFDRIKILGTVRRTFDDDLSMAKGASYDAEWLAEAEAIATTQIRDTYHNGESHLEAFIRLMMGIHRTDGLEMRSSTEQYYGHYQAAKKFFDAAATVPAMERLIYTPTPNYELPPGFLEQPLETIETMEKADIFLTGFREMTRLRRFCVTEQGRMAIMPPRSKVGDVLCILKGARTPFVLRGSSEKPPVYNLVGCCYIHGVMGGEIDIQESQTFVLA
jgi:hypothetical protein